MRALLASPAVPAILAVVAAIWVIIALFGGPVIYHGGDELGPLTQWPDRYRAAWTRPVPTIPSVAARDGDLVLADRDSELRLNRAADEVDPSLSPGGDWLLFASNREGGEGGFDLWIAPREGTGFGEASRIGEPVSSLFHERSPSLALLPDGSLLLLFASNRGHGLPTDHDLWLARRSPEGRWEPPELVRELSTAADERGAALHPEGDAIVFTRPGRRGIGFLESHRRPDGSWSAPEELRALVHPDNGPEVRYDEGGSALLFARGDDTMRSRLRILRELPEGGAPWGAWILLALSALLLLLRYLASRWHGLETIYRCLLISVLVHLLLWWWLADHGIDATLPSGPGSPGGEIAPIELDPDLFTDAASRSPSERAHGESVALAAAEEAAAAELRPLAARRAPLPAQPADAAEIPARAELAAEPAEANLAAVAPLDAPARGAPAIDAPELALRADPGRAVAESERAPERAAPAAERETAAIEAPRVPAEGRELAARPPEPAEPSPVAGEDAVPAPEAPAATAAREVAPEAPPRAPAAVAGAAAALAADPGPALPAIRERDDAAPAPERSAAGTTAIRPALPASARDEVAPDLPAAELVRIDGVAHAESPAGAARPEVARAAPVEPAASRPAAAPAREEARSDSAAAVAAATIAAAAPREIEIASETPVRVAPPELAGRPLIPARRSGEAASEPPPAVIAPASLGGLRPSEEESAEAARALGHAGEIAPAEPRAPAPRPEGEEERDPAGRAIAASAAAAAAAPREIDFAPAAPAAPSAGGAGAIAAPSPLPAPSAAVARTSPSPEAPPVAAPAALAGETIEPFEATPPPAPRAEVAAAAALPVRGAARGSVRNDATESAAAAPPAAAAGPAARSDPGEIAFAPVPAPALPGPERPAPPAPPVALRENAPLGAPAAALPEIAAADVAPASERRGEAARAEEWVPWISARRGARKVEALRTGGGNERTEAAVDAGLAYLASRQRDGGGWGDERQRHPKYGETAVGRTALALLAFLGAGHGPGMGTVYSERTEQAIAWLLSIQERETGHFGAHTAAYSHAIATYALGEAVLMGAGEDVRAAMERGIAQILRNQESDPNRPDLYGGWSYYYHDGHRYDSYPRVSVTVWQVMALETAELAGLDIPEASIDAAKRWILGQWSDRLGRFLYHLDPERLRSRYPTLPASTPGAAFILQVLGHPVEDRALAGALAMVAARPPTEWQEASADRFIEHGEGNSYFWYYGTLALFLRGGEAWQGWNDALQRCLLPSQDPDGSWRPICPYAGYAGDTDGERIYTTALNVLMLEVYYRYLTPFQQSLLDNR